jgi:hypothetical protein
MKPIVEAHPKRPYQAPKLTPYGDLTQITLGSGTMGNMDAPHSMRTAP